MFKLFSIVVVGTNLIKTLLCCALNSSIPQYIAHVILIKCENACDIDNACPNIVSDDNIEI